MSASNQEVRLPSSSVSVQNLVINAGLISHTLPAEALQAMVSCCLQHCNRKRKLKIMTLQYTLTCSAQARSPSEGVSLAIQ